MMAEESQKSFALSRRFSVAPMMAWTDRHARYFLRLISQRALLYTEMVPVNASFMVIQNVFLNLIKPNIPSHCN